MDRYRGRVDKTWRYRGRPARDLEGGAMIESIRDELPEIGISVDTRRPSVALEALESAQTWSMTSHQLTTQKWRRN